MGTTVPIEHPWRFTQESFVVECRSVSGYSGSPVFIYRVQTTITAGFVAIGADARKYGEESLPRFLGLDWGHLDRVGHNDYAIDWADAASAILCPSSGMMVAVPAWRLAELLDSPEVQDVKMEAEDKAKKASEGVNLDFEPSGLDATADLMGKLLKVPKNESDEVHRNHSRDRSAAPR